MNGRLSKSGLKNKLNINIQIFIYRVIKTKEDYLDKCNLNKTTSQAIDSGVLLKHNNNKFHNLSHHYLDCMTNILLWNSLSLYSEPKPTSLNLYSDPAYLVRIFKAQIMKKAVDYLEIPLNQIFLVAKLRQLLQVS